jgi:hypothetical protein
MLIVIVMINRGTLCEISNTKSARVGSYIMGFNSPSKTNIIPNISMQVHSHLKSNQLLF